MVLNPTHLADAVLITHAAFVAFVVGGLILIFWGRLLGWGWVRNPVFRLIHLAAIGFVVAQAWWGAMCPLTTLESALREAAGGTPYQDGFIEHWVQAVLFYDLPEWVFVAAYSLFGLLVAASWFLVRPRPFRRRK